MADSDEKWTGPERRIEQIDRRIKNDRRDDIRFEPVKKDRRSGHDRRKSRQDPWKEHET
jgi:hypothetical protein